MKVWLFPSVEISRFKWPFLLEKIMQGWISIHRKIKEWEWYGDSKVVHLFLHCLMSANHKPKKWKGIQIEAGQFITSRDKLSAELPLSVQQVRTALNKLKSTGEITIKTTTKYSMISITNWDEYQNVNQPINQQVTSNQPTNNQQITTNNNVNNDNNVNKKEEKPKKPSTSKLNKPDNVEEEVWQDWLTLRKTKRAPVTNTVLKGAIKQAVIANISLNEFLQIWCRRGSQGLEASWIKPDERQNQAPAMRPLNGTGQTDTRSRAQKVSDKLDEIARRDIEENGFTQSLD